MLKRKKNDNKINKIQEINKKKSAKIKINRGVQQAKGGYQKNQHIGQKWWVPWSRGRSQLLPSSPHKSSNPRP